LYIPRRRAQRERFRELIREPNHPMHWPDRRLGLLWSAKAGCTLGIKWFFYQLGLYEEAMAYSSWVHHYRVRVFCHSDMYRDSSLRAARGGYRYIKFVRNPYQRAVGSFLHFVKTHGAKDFHRPFDEFLGRDLDDPPGVKFSEFVAYLETVDLANCDIHFRFQEHPLEREGLLKANYAIHLEDIDEKLPALERKLGLPVSPLDALGQSHHHTLRNSSREFCGDSYLMISEDDSYPPFECFYDEDLKQRVARLYQRDFERYGFSTEL
jgi:hypothetical protein